MEQIRTNKCGAQVRFGENFKEANLIRTCVAYNREESCGGNNTNLIVHHVTTKTTECYQNQFADCIEKCGQVWDVDQEQVEGAGTCSAGGEEGGEG